MKCKNCGHRISKIGRWFRHGTKKSWVTYPKFACHKINCNCRKPEPLQKTKKTLGGNVR